MVGAGNEGSGTPAVEFRNSELWRCANPDSVEILCQLRVSGKIQQGGKKYPLGEGQMVYHLVQARFWMSGFEQGAYHSRSMSELVQDRKEIL